MPRAVVSACILACILVAGCPGAAAFFSFPAGSSVHDGITADAARSLGFPAQAIKALSQATRRPDYDDSKVKLLTNGSLQVETTAQYQPWHHCDRGPGTTDAQAFEATVQYAQRQRELALVLARQGSVQDAAAAIGRGLHALQDCFAHSDLVSGGAAAERAYERTLAHGGPPLPGLHVTGFDPNATDTLRPPGDPFPYVSFNLDDVDSSGAAREVLPDGNTKFEHARQDAIAATRMYLLSILDNLTAEQQAALRDVHQTTPPLSIPIPAAGLAPLLLSLGITVVRRRP